MIDLWILIKKNIKTLFRQRTASLMIIFGPLLITLMTGLAFDNSNYNLKVGIYSETASPIATSLFQSLSEEGFKMINYRTIGNCVETLKKSEINLCLHIVQQNQGETADITFYVDYSRLNLVWQLLNVIDTQISSKSSELSMNFTAQVLESIETTKNELDKNKDTLVMLTTQNDEINKKIRAMVNILKASELNVNLTSLDNVSALLEENILLNTMAKLNEYSVELIEEYSDTTDEVVTKLENSAISEQDKQQIISRINQGRENIRLLNDKVKAMTGISRNELAELQDYIAKLSTDMEGVREEYYTLYGFKISSISNLEKLLSELDKNLITILSMQRALNKINANYENLKITDPATALAPIKTTIKPVAAKKTRMHYVFPILLVLMIMFTGILLAPVLISAERDSPAAIRNMLTPVSRKTFIAAAFLSCFIILGVQMLLVAGISVFFLGLNILLGFPFSVISVMMIMAFFILTGMLLGYTIKTEGLSLLGGTLAGIFLIIFSDFVLPLESLPYFLAAVMKFNPIIISTVLLKKTLLFDLPLADIGFDLVFLLLACMLIGIIVFLIGRKQFNIRKLRKTNKTHAKNDNQNS